MCHLIQSFTQLFNDVPQPCSLVTCKIQLLPDACPIKQNPYRISPSKREWMKKEIKFLLENNLIEPSDSEWASPCVLVPKSDGNYRMCTDYRKVNSLTCPDSFPMPRIDDIIDGIGSAKFVSNIDLLRGYYQIPLSNSAKRISAFVTPDGLFAYRVMPFGLRNAPATFQRLMTKVTAGLERVRAYLDYLVLYDETWDNHLENLLSLFHRLSDAGLTVNLQKS